MLNKIIQGVGVGFFLLALFLVHQELIRVGGDHILHLLRGVPFHVVGSALALTVLDFCFLAGYDALSLKHLNKHLNPLKIFAVAGLGFAVSNTTGHAYLAGGSLRYMFYRTQLSRIEILKLIALDSLTFLLGVTVAFIGTVCLLPTQGVHLPPLWQHLMIGISLFLLVVLNGYFWGIVRPKRTFKIGSVLIKAPSVLLTCAQVCMGLGDVFCTFLVFYVILSGLLPVPFFSLMGMFILAWVLGLVSQIPGGLGVFEGTFLYLFSSLSSQSGEVLTALLIFRILYYFVPFLLATCLLVGGWGIKKLFYKI